MANPLGRISGQLLKDNLTRNGHDLQFDTDLMYLNVNQRFIGVNLDTPFRPLTVDGTTKTTNLIVDTEFKNPTNDLVFTAGQIESLTGNINLVGSTLVYTLNTRTDNINIDDNVISTLDNNTDIEIRPTGSFEVYNNVNVTGSIYATGDLTIDGSIIFGSDDNDNVSFAADIDSDIIPDQDGEFSIGRNDRQWAELHTNLINGQQITTGGISIPSGVNLALRQGKTWYVATLGSDTNQGNHQNGAFATIEHALSVATSGDEILIYPGNYVEAFPLTVPVGVMVKGQSLRTVIVKPTAGTNTNNAFLVNGETTVSDITVSDFYQGYAFSFAPGAKTTTRSPYIQNCSVITRGSVITAEDPLGFDSSDAGKGALVDGSVCDSTTLEAAMLFHSVTFITPGVDALTMTNGVRVEWLNSFTYFANRSLYATNGALGLASLGVKFGAEVRTIASASVYGNYGAVADGADTLMYLIQYNFAYIGAGKDSSNDNTLYIEANNVVELNSGQIVYQSVDQKGKFKVGNAFYVDFETGSTSIDVTDADITGLSSILLKSGTQQTYIDYSKLDTGELIVRDNNLLSKSGPVNIVAASGEVNLNQDVLISKDLSVTGNLTFDGSLTFGNQVTDTISFTAPVEFDFLPTINSQFDLGSVSKTWKSVDLDYTFVGLDIEIGSSLIQTTNSNSNLDLRASGTGRIYVPFNNVLFNNTLTVNTTTNLEDTVIVGNVQHTGSVLKAGDLNLIGDTDITGEILVSNIMQFDNIRADANELGTTESNSSLELTASGTGTEVIFNDSVIVDQNLSANYTSTNFANVATTVTADAFFNANMLIQDNVIETTNSNSDLELYAAGTGKIYVPSDNVQLDQDLTVNGLSTLKNTNITGLIQHIGLTTQTGNVNQTGSTILSDNQTVTEAAYFTNIDIVNNLITTSDSNSDLELRAAGSGIINVNDNLVIDQNLTIDVVTTTTNITNTGTVTADIFTDNNIVITDNIIETTVSNSDLELYAASTGKIYALLDSVEIEQSLTVNGLSTLKNTNITGLLDHTGSVTQTGSTTQTGSLILSNNLTVTVDAYFTNIDIINNVVRTSDSNSDLELRAVGTGIVIVNDNFVANQNLTVDVVTSTSNITNTSTVTANIFTDNNIVITDNRIETTNSNSDLELYAAGTGKIRANADPVIIEQSLTVHGTTNLIATNIVGLLTETGTTTQTGSTLHTGNINISNDLTVSAAAYFTNIDIVDNYIRTTDSNSDLELRAVGSGVIAIPNDSVTFSQRLDVIGLTSTSNISNTTTITSNIFTDLNIVIEDNYIATTVGNSNLILTGAGLGGPKLEKLKFNTNILSTESNNDNIILGTSKILYTNTTTGFKVPHGTNVQRPTANKILGELRFSTTDNVFTGFSAAPVHFGGGVYSSDRQTYIRAHPTNNTINFVTNNQKMMDVTTAGFSVNGLLVDNTLWFNGSTIETVTPGAEIDLTPHGTGKTILSDIAIYQGQWINQNATTPITFAHTGDGHIKLSGSALQIPVGDTASQPDVPELGDLRWNTDDEATEVFNGTAYQSIQGAGTGYASQDDIDDLTNLWAIILG